MKLKGTKLYSVLTFTCPRCHEGKFFKQGNSYRKGFAEARPSCSHCGEDFRREPGYYFGAAYVSYALTVALWVAVYVALWVFDALGWISFRFFENGWMFLIVGSIVLLALMPPLYRLSRIIWINMFVDYRDDAVEFNRALRLEEEKSPQGEPAESA